MKQKYQCKTAKSLGELNDTPNNIWGTSDYISRKEPTVFWGLYDLRDYIVLWRHKGKKYTLWAGSDIRNLVSGFIWNDGKLRWLSKLCPGFKFILKKILNKSEHWVENGVEYEALLKWGIKANICPSWLGNIYMPESYYWRKDPQVYISCGQSRQEEYGFGIIEKIADKLPQITFHLYGDDWQTKHKNVIIHGRVSKEQMNEEIKEMQCGLRLNEFDGFSEITAKATLMGQWAITKIPYPYIPFYKTEEELIQILQSLSLTYYGNAKGRRYYQENLNKYPWNAKLFNK